MNVVTVSGATNDIFKDAEAEIVLMLPCKCEFLCIFNSDKEDDYVCSCKPEFKLADDGFSCIGEL